MSQLASILQPGADDSPSTPRRRSMTDGGLAPFPSRHAPEVLSPMASNEFGKCDTQDPTILLLLVLLLGDLCGHSNPIFPQVRLVLGRIERFTVHLAWSARCATSRRSILGDADVVVCMTSHGSRIRRAHHAIESIAPARSARRERSFGSMKSLRVSHFRTVFDDFSAVG